MRVREETESNSLEGAKPQRRDCVCARVCMLAPFLKTHLNPMHACAHNKNITLDSLARIGLGTPREMRDDQLFPVNPTVSYQSTPPAGEFHEGRGTRASSPSTSSLLKWNVGCVPSAAEVSPHSCLGWAQLLCGFLSLTAAFFTVPLLQLPVLGGAGGGTSASTFSYKKCQQVNSAKNPCFSHH